MAPAFESLCVEDVTEGVVEVLLDRPERRNALTAAMEHEYARALEWVAEQAEVRVAIVRGAGGFFTSGHDISGDPATGNVPYGMTFSENVEHQRQRQRWRLAGWYCPKPVVALTQGGVFGAGLDIAMGCDLVVSAESCVFGHPAMRFGASPTGALWGVLLGPQMAKRLLLTGDSVSARDARAVGIVTEVVPDDRVEDVTRSLADRLALVPREVSYLNKQYVNRMIEILGFEEMRRVATDYNALGHRVAGSAETFNEHVSEAGLTTSIAERDAAFGDYTPGSGRQPTRLWL